MNYNVLIQVYYLCNSFSITKKSYKKFAAEILWKLINNFYNVMFLCNSKATFYFNGIQSYVSVSVFYCFGYVIKIPCLNWMVLPTR